MSGAPDPSGGPAHVTAPVVAPAQDLPSWATLVRAPNPGPMTLDGTNSWILRLPGAGTVVVDPGPLDEGHLAALAGYGPLDGILITHGHPDHVEGVARLRDLTGAPVLDEVPGVRRLATPGHTADSVCFLVSDVDQPAVLTGDTVLGKGTTVVAYPDGDLRDYLTSLERLAALGPVPVLPGHGPPLADCAAAAEFYLRHRNARLAQVRAVVAAGARTPAEVMEIVYADVDRSVWFAAEMSVRAQLALIAKESEPGTVWLDTP
ncbi:MAG TPA: MBL fold metallo-hydrolase [Rugosimonospora sp.]|nr:MBL fold metallo-hydrolase [Rugosimonospora sp.]